MPPAQAQPSPWWISRGAALVVASGVFLICLFINAGLAWVAVAAVVLMEGAVALLIMLAGGLLGCAILRWGLKRLGWSQFSASDFTCTRASFSARNVCSAAMKLNAAAATAGRAT